MPELESPAIILLAAGGSMRMRRPKQLLLVEGKPLLRHVVDASLSDCFPFIVVLGSHFEAIGECLAGADVRVVVNESWREGVGSSICRGINALRDLSPEATGVIVALADQPDFSRLSIERITVERARTGKRIVATESGGVLMPPAYFSAYYFGELASLSGDKGARDLFLRHRNDVAAVRQDPMVDLDTPQDYSRFIAGSPSHGASDASIPHSNRLA